MAVRKEFKKITGICLAFAAAILLLGGVRTKLPAVRAEADAPAIIGYSGQAGYSMYLLEGNKLYGVGVNNVGQLATGTVTPERPRYQVKEINMGLDAGVTNEIKQVSAGVTHVAAVTTDGQLYTWGFNSVGQLGIGRRGAIEMNAKEKGFIQSRDAAKPMRVDVPAVQSVATGAEFTIALDENGNVWSFGSNLNGQLGTGEETAKGVLSDAPQKVRGVGGAEYLTDIVQIVAAETAAFALDKNGAVYAWGSNYNGLCGDGGNTNRSVPVRVRTADGALSGIVKIEAYYKNAAALDERGTLYVWGDNMYGQAGNGTYDVSEKMRLAQQVAYLSENGIEVQDISVAVGMVHVLSKDGKLYGWGMCGDGSLGIGIYQNVPDYAKEIVDGVTVTRNQTLFPVPIAIRDGEEEIKVGKILSIDNGRGFLADENGDVFSWGNNDYGQAGVASGETFLPGRTKLDFSAQNDTVYAQKNYMIVPIVVICITVALIILAVIRLNYKKKKMDELDLEFNRKIQGKEKQI